MKYRGFKIRSRNNRFYVYHPDGKLLIRSASKEEAIGFIEFYSDPNKNW